MLSKLDLPQGSVIVVDAGYQYRPDGWTDDETLTANGKRSGNVTANLKVIDEQWWAYFTLRGFNLSRTDGAVLTDADVVHLRICVPVSAQ